MHRPAAPEPRDLLPPLLACLPTTFVSSRPPPALLPLLAPILRQRISYLSASDGPTHSDGWVRLLSWDAHRAAKLPSIVEHLELEPHPVSGEVEIDDVDDIKYRRLDEETLHARLEVVQFDLLPIFVWCETDEHGGTGPGWKLTELRCLEDVEDGASWYSTVSQANDAASSVPAPIANGNGNGNSNGHPAQASASQTSAVRDDDDDDYWAAYDRTPGRTPAIKRSPAPQSMTAASAQTSNRDRTQSELEYFARYGNEVQPALDSHDPDEHQEEVGASTLTGTTQRTRSAQDPPIEQQRQEEEDTRPDWQKALYPHVRTRPQESPTSDQSIEQPRPISPASSNSSVERLEQQAAAMHGQQESRAERGIKQHIATDIKSLFRLASSVGMERSEFERVVKTELDLLTLMDRDE